MIQPSLVNLNMTRTQEFERVQYKFQVQVPGSHHQLLRSRQLEVQKPFSTRSVFKQFVKILTKIYKPFNSSWNFDEIDKMQQRFQVLSDLVSFQFSHVSMKGLKKNIRQLLICFKKAKISLGEKSNRLIVERYSITEQRKRFVL